MQIFFCFNTKIQELIFFGTYNIDFSNILLNPKKFYVCISKSVFKINFNTF